MGNRTKTAGIAQSSARPSLWILSSWQDLLLVVASPLLILALFEVGRRTSTTTALLTFGTILALSHHLPGMMRAYGDKALFRRFRVRFIVAPIFLLSASIYCAIQGYQIVLYLAWAWGSWHWMMQGYGFMRIYDSKVKSFDTLTRWLDFLMCVVWWGVAVISSPRMFHFAMEIYYHSGGPQLPAGTHAAVRYTWFAFTLLITCLFLVQMVRQIKAGTPPSLLKLVLMSVTLGYFYYTVVVVSDRLIGYILFEAFHDIQYLTIVWIFNRGRAEKSPSVGAFTRFLFRRRFVFVLLYVAICFAYGSYDYVANHVSFDFFAEHVAKPGVWQNVAMVLITSSAMLHFYFDGFIWKIREPTTRDSLDLQSTRKATPKPAPAPRPAWRHALVWSLFVVPLIVVGYLEVRKTVPSKTQRNKAIAETLPKSPMALANVGSDLFIAGKHTEAITISNRALEIEPNNTVARITLGSIHGIRGELDLAEESFHRAIESNPRFFKSYIGLAITLVQQGKHEQAVESFRTAIKLSPRPRDTSEAHIRLANALIAQEKTKEGVKHLREAIRIDPRSAKAFQRLGEVLESQGKIEEAETQLRQAIEISPEFAPAHNILAQLLSGLGRLDEAEKHFLRVVQLRPNDAQAHYNLAEFLARRKQPAEAEKHFRRIVQLLPSDALARNNLGEILAEQRKFKEAELHFRRALDLQPNHARAINNLRRLQSDPRQP